MASPWDNLRLKAAIGAPLMVAPPQVLTAPQIFQPPSRFDQLMAVANSEMGEYSQYAEVHRITGLPIVPDMDPGALEEFNRTHLLADAYQRGFRFFPVQANAIDAYEKCAGFFGPVGVGWGKTLISYACAGHAYRKGLRKIIYSVPANVYDQNAQEDLRWARTKIPIPYPVFRLGSKSVSERRQMCAGNRPGLYIMPYSQYSTVDAEEIIWTIEPDLVILDECHKARNRGAARTKRLMKYLQEKKPEVVCLSGTITSKSVKDYHHLISCALDLQSPLPLSGTLSSEWAAVLDSNAEEEGSATGPLMPLIQWALTHFPEEEITEDRSGFRRAFRLRMDSSPGVVATGDADIGVSLSLSNSPVENFENYANWPYLKTLMEQVEEQWLTPNGDEIEHAIHTWKWMYELSAGFFNQLTWPTPEVYAERKSISFGEAQDILTRAVVHHSALQDYHKILRRWLHDFHVQGVDTPFLVGQDMSRKGTGTSVSPEVYDAWRCHKALDFPDRPDRDSTAIRVCDFKVNDACIWASQLPKGEGGIIWVYHNAMGQWIYEYLKHFGMDVLHCPSGTRHNETIRDPKNKNKIVVASITSHGEGKNLQHFYNQYVMQWPRSASRAEQFLGRTHRNGQEADEVLVRTNNTLAVDDMNFAACLNDALYIHQTSNRQKLIYCGFRPLPIIFSSSFLIERGLEAKKLTQLQEALLQETFGGA